MQNLRQQSVCLLAVLALFGGAAVGSAKPAFYITAGVGGSETTSRWDINTSAEFVSLIETAPPQPTTILTYENNATEDIEDIFGQFGIGFGIRFMQRLFLGVEASIAPNTTIPVIKDSANLNETYGKDQPVPPTIANLGSETKLSVQDPDINIDLKLGVHISPYSMIYLKGGAVLNRLKLESTSTYLYENKNVNIGVPHSFTSSITSTEEKDVTGIHVVLGIEHLITRNLAFNAEYAYVHYGDISVSGVTSTTSTIFNAEAPITIADGLQMDNTATATKQSVMLGLVLYIGRQY